MCDSLKLNEGSYCQNTKEKARFGGKSWGDKERDEKHLDFLVVGGEHEVIKKDRKGKEEKGGPQPGGGRALSG